MPPLSQRATCPQAEVPPQPEMVEISLAEAEINPPRFVIVELLNTTDLRLVTFITP